MRGLGSRRARSDTSLLKCARSKLRGKESLCAGHCSGATGGAEGRGQTGQARLHPHLRGTSHLDTWGQQKSVPVSVPANKRQEWPVVFGSAESAAECSVHSDLPASDCTDKGKSPRQGS